MEPRGFEPLTSCLQIGLISRDNALDLGERQSASDREYPLLTALNGTLMARRSCSWGCRRLPRARVSLDPHHLARLPVSREPFNGALNGEAAPVHGCLSR
ncbi:hypothetical protein GCM10023074_28810 [Microbispora amethystogenes]|uniref:Uncharacterized protein n=1 Tax=Microbispora amethystogenes TaxID=1427754 RepID=A0ABQ4FA12_9ACTN|nr:hypothetical protein Mam01_18280 [Microbispora amethystogenes]